MLPLHHVVRVVVSFDVRKAVTALHIAPVFRSRAECLDFACRLPAFFKHNEDNDTDDDGDQYEYDDDDNDYS